MLVNYLIFQYIFDINQMEKVVLGDFLQVTINSCKLIQLINNLVKTINDQQLRLNSLNNILSNVNDKIQENYTFFTLQANKSQKIRQRDCELQKEILNQIKFSIQKNSNEIRQNLFRNQTQIKQLQRIFKQKNQQIEQKLIIQTSNISVNFSQIIASAKKSQIQQINANIELIKKQIDQISSKKVIIKQNLKQKDTKDDIEEKINSPCKDRNKFKKISRISLSKKISNHYLSEGKCEKINEIDQINENEQHNNSIFPIVPILYQIQQNKSNDQSVMNEFIKLSTDKTNQIVDFSNFYSSKIEQISEELKKQIEDNNLSINLTQNKNMMIEQKLNIFARKFERQINKIYQIKTMIKSMENTKGFQEKMIKNIKIQMQSLRMSLQKMIKLKLDTQLFQRYNKELSKKLQQTFDKFQQKADRLEVKKAIIFLEEKIKQIILLVTNQKNIQRQGAASRISLKCLSCDKQMESKLKINTNMSMRPRQKTIVRAQSSHIRRKIRKNQIDQFKQQSQYQ